MLARLDQGSLCQRPAPTVGPQTITIAVPNTALAATLGTNGTGTAKLDPYFLSSFMRLYFGADAMAGLVYIAWPTVSKVLDIRRKCAILVAVSD